MDGAAMAASEEVPTSRLDVGPPAPARPDVPEAVEVLLDFLADGEAKPSDQLAVAALPGPTCPDSFDHMTTPKGSSECASPTATASRTTSARTSLPCSTASSAAVADVLGPSVPVPFPPPPPLLHQPSRPSLPLPLGVPPPPLLKYSYSLSSPVDGQGNGIRSGDDPSPGDGRQYSMSSAPAHGLTSTVAPRRTSPVTSELAKAGKALNCPASSSMAHGTSSGQASAMARASVSLVRPRLMGAQPGLDAETTLMDELVLHDVVGGDGKWLPSKASNMHQQQQQHDSHTHEVTATVPPLHRRSWGGPLVVTVISSSLEVVRSVLSSSPGQAG